MPTQELDWDYPEPHVIEHTATDSEADGYGHINNSVYLNWLDQCIWDHCRAVDMPPEKCQELSRGFVAVRHEIDYLAASYPGDKVAIANWVTANDGRLRGRMVGLFVCLRFLKSVLLYRQQWLPTYSKRASLIAFRLLV